MLEAELQRFSVNDYRGLPDASAFSVVEGTLPVVVSAPHAVSQLREGRVKSSEDFTGALALAVAELSGARCQPRYDANCLLGMPVSQGTRCWHFPQP